MNTDYFKKKKKPFQPKQWSPKAVDGLFKKKIVAFCPAIFFETYTNETPGAIFCEKKKVPWVLLDGSFMILSTERIRETMQKGEKWGRGRNKRWRMQIWHVNLGGI